MLPKGSKKRNEWRRKHYQELKALGICVRCNCRKAILRQILCIRCSDADDESAMAYARNHKSEKKIYDSDRREKFRAEGRCTRCGVKLIEDEKKICSNCSLSSHGARDGTNINAKIRRKF